MADARARAMAADKTDIVAERQQLFGDRLDQRGVAAAGQVGAADRAVEQYVADMRPRDMIDMQSFLWVQGSDEYPD